MINVINFGYSEFKTKTKGKRIIVYGAGRALDNCLNSLLSKHKILMIIDKNNSTWGKTITHNGEIIEIASLDRCKDVYKKSKDKEEILMIINSAVYAAEIIEMLDNIPELDGLNCCVQALMVYRKEEICPYGFSKGEQKIPKKIHYIWLGERELPELYRRNIETWKKYNRDYDILRWDETNYDFMKNQYVKEAYEKKAWGFVPNFARLDIVFEHGGIYLDVDVEAVGNFDKLLSDRAFFNMGRVDRVNQGCGFGAERGNNIIGEMRREFEKASLMDDNGKYIPCHSFIQPILNNHGFRIENQYQKIDDCVLYPNEVMSPNTIPGMEDYFSDKTVSIHQEIGSWRSEKEKKGIERLVSLARSRGTDNTQYGKDKYE